MSLITACSDDTTAVNSDEQARRVYLGLDTSIEKSLKLGFDGFNTASSANIAPQTVVGMTAGMLTITGQVDQGNSANKGMRLHVGMVGYTDGPFIVNDHNDTVEVIYDTDPSPALQPALTLSLKNIPTGTLDGTLIGVYHVHGAIAGDVALNLVITGTLMDVAGKVTRAAGTTITGTATQADGVYNVMVTL